jgi:arsenate reductase (glutaredoxin)
VTQPFPITIFHNPECGTSRNVLAIVEAAGYSPVIVDYLAKGWTRPHLLGLFAAAGVTARQALRETKSPAAELGLLGPGVAEDALIEAMTQHPVLVNRPFVETPKGMRLCRPSEVVLDLLERWPPGPLQKEDGSPLIDAAGRRVGA